MRWLKLLKNNLNQPFNSKHLPGSYLEDYYYIAASCRQNRTRDDLTSIFLDKKTHPPLR
jgi:hypothetical protein